MSESFQGTLVPLRKQYVQKNNQTKKKIKRWYLIQKTKNIKGRKVPSPLSENTALQGLLPSASSPQKLVC